MKFKNGRMKFAYLRTKLRVDAYDDGSVMISVDGSAIPLTREEARKFAKAIRKEVRKVQV